MTSRDMMTGRRGLLEGESKQAVPGISAVQAAIKAVWDEHDDEVYRQDVSHYRGVGRWADDRVWQRIGRRSVARFALLWRLLKRSRLSLSGLTALEWGPGGGANAFGLRNMVDTYYGIDVSQKNLLEAQRVMEDEGRNGYFRPVLLQGFPSEISASIEEPVDIFLSTAVFQHFPSQRYGADVLEAIRSVCSDGAAGFVQIRFDNGNERFAGISSLDEYREKHITANSYPLDAFWDLIAERGFTPIAINEIHTSNNYATFYMKAR